MADDNQIRLEKLRTMRDSVYNWETEKELREFVRNLYDLIVDWTDELPDLRQIFRPTEIDRLLSESITFLDLMRLRRIIEFVASTGYKDYDLVEADDNGRPSPLRTTPIHRLARCRPMTHCSNMMRELFQIYHRSGVNYTDEATGLTHFHVACAYGLVGTVVQFLSIDPARYRDLLLPETGDTPLLLAARRTHGLVEILLDYGANPNLANLDGSTVLHIVCGNVRLGECHSRFAKLLHHGADPNSQGTTKTTPLHALCKRAADEDAHKIARKFLDLCNEYDRPVRIDTRDQLGRTPLQWAVANCSFDMIDLLLARGADMSSFSFPTEDYFGANLDALYREDKGCRSKLIRASLRLAVVEHMEMQGYKLGLSDVVTILKPFADWRLLEEPATQVDLVYLAMNPCFARKSKTIVINPRASLYDFLTLPADRLAERKITRRDLYECARSHAMSRLSEEHLALLLAHLVYPIAQELLDQWSMHPLMTLSRHRLSFECCETITKRLTNRDLYHVCRAIARQSDNDKRLARADETSFEMMWNYVK